MIYQQFAHWARMRPAALALVSTAYPPWTYAQALRAVDGIARRLHDAGVRAGDKVTLPGGNFASLLCQFALDKLGACSCVMTRSQPWIKLVIQTEQPDAPGIFRIPRPLAPEVFDDWPDDGPPLHAHDWKPDEPARIKTSSGSTGKPKFIQRGHASTLRGLEINRNLMGLGPGMICTHVLGYAGPAQTLKTNTWMTGGTFAIVTPGPQSLFPELERLDVDVLAISPTNLQSALQVSPPTRRYPGLSVFFFGARASVPLLERASRDVTHKLVMTYGSTETSSSLAAFLSERTFRGTTYGVVSPLARLEVVDGAGQPAPPGEQGRVRLQILSPGADGYLDADGRHTPFNPADPQWFYPGDTARMGADGLVEILGRHDDVLNFGGRKLTAVDVEDAVQACQATLEHAALNVQGPDGLLRPAVAVVLSPGATAAGLRLALRKQLPFALDFLVLTFPRLPRLPNGKVDFVRVRSMYKRGAPRDAHAPQEQP